MIADVRFGWVPAAFIEFLLWIPFSRRGCDEDKYSIMYKGNHITVQKVQLNGQLDIFLIDINLKKE